MSNEVISSSVYYVSILSDIIREMRIKEHQKVVAKKEKNKIIISDWKK